MAIYSILIALLALTCIVWRRAAIKLRAANRGTTPHSPSFDTVRVSSTAPTLCTYPLEPTRVGVVRPLAIHLFEGVGPIRFGMTPAEVRRILAEPEGDESLIRGNDNGSLRLRGMVLWCWPQTGVDEPPPESTLDRIELFDRPGTTLWGRNLHDWTEEKLTRELESLGLGGTRDDEHSCISVGVDVRFGFDRDRRIDYVDLEVPDSNEPGSA